MAEKFTSLTAVAVPYDAVNVDTDQIIPARFLKVPRSEGYGRFLFHDLRSENPEFVLNREPYREARIFVGNRNFGCGSSREGAAYAFYDQGFRGIIAPSFAEIFHNNCVKNGIAPVRLPEAVCNGLLKTLSEQPGTQLTVDLEQQCVLESNGARHEFSMEDFFREMLLQGVDEIGLTQSLVAEIEAFERRYAAEFPWAMR